MSPMPLPNRIMSATTTLLALFERLLMSTRPFLARVEIIRAQVHEPVANAAMIDGHLGRAARMIHAVQLVGRAVARPSSSRRKPDKSRPPESSGV